MTNETQDVDLNNEGEEAVAETPQEIKVEKPTETPEARLARLERQAKQLRKKLGVEETEAKPQEIDKPKESTELDYGQKAFLKASGISGADEVQLAKDFAKRTGLDLDAVIEDDIFLARLEKLRTTKANALASDTKSNRSGTSSGRQTVEYWLAKGEHPPRELGAKLAQEYVKARLNQGTNSKMFYND